MVIQDRQPTCPFIFPTNITDKKIQTNMPNSCVHISTAVIESNHFVEYDIFDIIMNYLQRGACSGLLSNNY